MLGEDSQILTGKKKNLLYSNMKKKRKSNKDVSQNALNDSYLFFWETRTLYFNYIDKRSFIHIEAPNFKLNTDISYKNLLFTTYKSAILYIHRNKILSKLKTKKNEELSKIILLPFYKSLVYPIFADDNSIMELGDRSINDIRTIVFYNISIYALYIFSIRNVYLSLKGCKDYQGISTNLDFIESLCDKIYHLSSEVSSVGKSFNIDDREVVFDICDRLFIISKLLSRIERSFLNKYSNDYYINYAVSMFNKDGDFKSEIKYEYVEPYIQKEITSLLDKLKSYIKTENVRYRQRRERQTGNRNKYNLEDISNASTTELNDIVEVILTKQK